MDLSLQIETIDNPCREYFLKNYFHLQKPVIIRGLLDQSHAGHWDFEFMKQQLGHVSVDVFDSRMPNNSAFVHGNIEMRFSDFLDKILQPEEHCPYRLFLFNGFKHSQQLQKDFLCPEIFKGILDKIGFMFFAGKNTAVRMHYDIDMSSILHTHFHGQKRVILVPPQYTKHMYKPMLNTFSIANYNLIADIDYSKFPALRNIKGYDIILNHGDSLFMPCGYWHYMIYLNPGFSVAYRKFPYGLRNQLNGALNLTTRLWTDKLLNTLFGNKWADWKNQQALAMI